MKPRDNRDLQTVNVFVVLVLLTLLFVYGFRAVLFAPSLESKGSQVPYMESSEAKKGITSP